MNRLGRPPVPPRPRPEATATRVQDRPGLALLAAVLAREAVVGLVLWAGRSWGQQDSAVLTAAVFGLVVAGTRWFGLAQRPGWGLTLRESLLVFAGGICMANLVTFIAGRG